MEKDRADVRLEVDAGQVERKGANAGSRRGANPRERLEGSLILGHNARMTLANLLRGAPEREGATVIAQTLPLGKHVCRGSGSKGIDRGKSVEPGLPSPVNARDLCLLEHCLGDPNRIGVTRATPRQVTIQLAARKIDAFAEGFDTLAHRCATPDSPGRVKRASTTGRAQPETASASVTDER